MESTQKLTAFSAGGTLYSLWPWPIDAHTEPSYWLSSLGSLGRHVSWRRSLSALPDVFVFPECQWPTGRSLETVPLLVTSPVSILCSVHWFPDRAQCDSESWSLEAESKVQLIVRKGDEDRIHLRRWLTTLASPTAMWGYGQRGQEWHGRHSRHQALGRCNKCLRGSLWWEGNGFQSASLLILQIN